jgi:hypothetical protein
VGIRRRRGTQFDGDTRRVRINADRDANAIVYRNSNTDPDCDGDFHTYADANSHPDVDTNNYADIDTNVWGYEDWDTDTWRWITDFDLNIYTRRDVPDTDGNADINGWDGDHPNSNDGGRYCNSDYSTNSDKYGTDWDGSTHID